MGCLGQKATFRTLGLLGLVCVDQLLILFSLPILWLDSMLGFRFLLGTSVGQKHDFLLFTLIYLPYANRVETRQQT